MQTRINVRSAGKATSVMGIENPTQKRAGQNLHWEAESAPYQRLPPRCPQACASRRCCAQRPGVLHAGVDMLVSSRSQGSGGQEAHKPALERGFGACADSGKRGYSVHLLTNLYNGMVVSCKPESLPIFGCHFWCCLWLCLE